ncbi:helix-turn-helix domain-containing protein [Chitinophaga sancti]|uniref:AraC family transcriptional regulator n=1 Tax=Chitinophaga sancti TaxID=1004 RepID=A0A1K1MVI1_9BACT|nr:AraC family transcriptional regulator [Chitinophaga sancti]WQD63030.1 AraC family transcriptional regulator [Chitinophaga sancti]WQG91345.1 AraC family transcriptional regulator [Chitinophaga sancti]SFW27204.1 AraC-type DNA-binding protein [Chitinophaga sancti]
MYVELPPSPDLAPFIKCFWLFDNNSGADLNYTTLPDGCLELLVFYQHGLLKSISVFGIQSEAYDILMPAHELKIGIRLRPLAKEYYLDKCTTLDRFADFTKTLSLQHFSELVSADIRAMSPAIDNRKQLLFDLLQKHAGNIEVESLATQCFWSSRQINRYFNKQLGLSLKSYCNILKCYASYKEIKAGDLNPDTGFYDQSHFIREIKKHTGTTPKKLLKNEAQRYVQFNSPEDV